MDYQSGADAFEGLASIGGAAMNFHRNSLLSMVTKTNDRNLTSRAQNRSRGALIIAEISMATVLLIGAGLLLKSFVTILGVDLGFRPERVMAMNINLPTTRYPAPADRLLFFENVEARVRALPDVQSVAFANRMPLRGGWGEGIQIEGNTDANGDVDRQAVSSGYFDTLGIRLVRGRLLTSADRAAQPFVTVVNPAFIRRFFANRDPRELVHAIREQVFAVDKDQPVTDVRTMDEIISTSVAQRRFQTTLLIAFALVAVTLALVGILGVLSYSVSQRTVELGIRMALGAQRQAIVAMALKQAAIWVTAGLLIGVAAAFTLSRYIASLLFDVHPHEWGAYTASA
jgi:putative ABC transport system permease protein